MQSDPRQSAESYNKRFKLAYAGKEKLKGTEIYVLHGELRDEFRKQLPADSHADAMFGAVRVTYGVKDGFPRSVEMLGTDGVAWMTRTFKNVKLNGKIDDAVFTYTPPAGVQVIDMSERMKAGPEAAGVAGESSEE